MKALNFFTALIAASFIPTAVFAQAALEPCGTITRNTTLKSDCAAPLIVGADNIKIDLNGFGVRSNDASIDEYIVLENRHGVTITNGKLEGELPNYTDSCYHCIQITGGYSNRVTNMVLQVGEEGIGVRVVNSKRNLIRNVKIVGSSANKGVSIIDSDKNIIDHLTNEGGLDTGAYIAGSHNLFKRSVIRTVQLVDTPVSVTVARGRGNIIDNNVISCSSSIPGILILGASSDTTVRSNTINACTTAIDTQAPRTIIKGNRVTNSSEVGIQVASLENTIRSNTVENSGTVDMLDFNPNCGTNDWKNNSFSTDSEGDGPRAGCIR
jgi:parallel beta-helix repeat protein